MDLDRLRLVVRTEERLSQGGLVVGFPVVANLQCVLALDSETAISVVTLDEIRSAGLEPKALFARAASNMEEALRPLAEVARPTQAGSINRLGNDDPYESSRIVDFRAWSVVSDTCEGDLLMAVPDWRLILYADSANEGAIEVLSATTARIFQASPYPLSPHVFRWDLEGWKRFPSDP